MIFRHAGRVRFVVLFSVLGVTVENSGPFIEKSFHSGENVVGLINVLNFNNLDFYNQFKHGNMKTRIQIFIVLIVLVSSSCRVLFENPQPLKTKALETIPAGLVGIYIEEKNSDTLIITKHSYVFNERGGHADNQSSGNLNSGRDVLKKFGNYYVYSKLANDSADAGPKMWYVFLLKPEDDRLEVSQVEDDNLNEKDTLDIGLLRKITPVKAIETNEKGGGSYSINPGKRQFKAMIKNDLFKTAYRFRKID